MQQDPYQMIRYFSDFLTEVNLIISGIKQSVYEIIDVHLSIQTGKNVQRSMSSIILATHKTFDDLKKIESILTGVIKSKRIISSQQSISSFKKRSKTTYSRVEQAPEQKDINAREINFEDNSKINCAKTVKRKLTSKQEIKEQFERSRSSEEEDYHKTNKNPSKNSQAKTIKNVVERGIQHSASQTILLKSCKSEENLKSIIKSNNSSLSKILQTNNDCLRIVRSAKKDLKRK